jgi:hypothetical protein
VSSFFFATLNLGKSLTLGISLLLLLSACGAEGASTNSQSDADSTNSSVEVSVDPNDSSSKKNFSLIIDLNDERAISGGVVTLSRWFENGDRAGSITHYFCSSATNTKWFDIWNPNGTFSGPDLPMGTINSLSAVLDARRIRIVDNENKLLGLSTEVKINVDESSACSIEYKFESVPFNDYPFAVDMTALNLGVMEFNVSEIDEGDLRIIESQIDIRAIAEPLIP